MVFVETSSLTGSNVQEAFQGVTKEVINKQNVQLRKVGDNNSGGEGKSSGGLRDKSFSKELEGGKKKKCC